MAVVVTVVGAIAALLLSLVPFPWLVVGGYLAFLALGVAATCSFRRPWSKGVVR